jgi:hypothetical protein
MPTKSRRERQLRGTGVQIHSAPPASLVYRNFRRVVFRTAKGECHSGAGDYLGIDCFASTSDMTT